MQINARTSSERTKSVRRPQSERRVTENRVVPKSNECCFRPASQDRSTKKTGGASHFNGDRNITASGQNVRKGKGFIAKVR